MHGTIPPERPDKPVEVKHRTITLTNRAPVRIVEDDWPIIAEGSCGDEVEGAPFGFSIDIKVRHRKHKYGGYIIHAIYNYFNDDIDASQKVRVGRLLTREQGMTNLWKHILETGDELRERIANEHLRKHVIYAVDECFASLAPHEM